MGICTRRTFLLTVCTLQLLSTVERQIFDFLGFMWAPILANFFHIVFVIFGFFGTFQYRPKYIIMYSSWNALWLGWNIFIICFYLDVGFLDKNSDILNLGTGSVSWWEINGIGCKAHYPTNLTANNPDPFRPLRPEYVSGCLLEYQYVEVIHAAFQCILAILAIGGGMYLTRVFLEEDDSSQAKPLGKRKMSCKRTSLYSIEFSPHGNNFLGEDNVEYSVEADANDSSQLPAPHLSPRPMTPRRVKRRSVISRGSTGRNSLPHYPDKRTSLRYNTARSSLRSSGRRTKVPHPSPVSRLIEQQRTLHQRHVLNVESSESNDSQRLNVADTSSQADLLVPKATSSPWKVPTGHINPLYQQNSSQSLQEDEDSYNNRPSSARSSYSNYHGTRPMSCYMPNGTLPYYITGQATAQVPVSNTLQNMNQNVLKSRQNANFFNNGPPAYDVEGGVTSETVI